MNKKNMLLTVLCAISATQITLPAKPQQSSKEPSELYATLISGGTIGSITGLLSAFTVAKSITLAGSIIQKHNNKVSEISSFFTFGVIVPILALISEYKLRSTLVNDINQNLSENEIPHNKNLIRDTAWIASWIAFLSCINFDK